MTHASVIRRVLVVLALGPFLASCERTNGWQEEVRLDDGQVIVLARQVSYEKAGGEWGRDSAWRPSGEQLAFINPLTGKQVTWAEPYRIASVVDVIDGTVWIIARQQACRPEDRGKPLWRAFALSATGWSPVGPDEAPTVSKPNLALDSANYSKTAHWQFVSIPQKQALDEASRVDARMKRIQWRSELDCPL